MGLRFPNPVGLPGGFDKHAQSPLIWQALGFGFEELGTVTALEQSGNPRPRIFRLEKDEALINRMGFNSDGADKVSARLTDHKKAGNLPNIPVFINTGKSKVTPLERAAQDYCYSWEKLRPFANVLVVNVSSPNTPDLRKLQDAELLGILLTALVEKERELARKAREKAKPILVKLAPDLTEPAIDDALQIGSDRGASGFIATNTTISRDGLKTQTNEQGGLSGKPLTQRAHKIVRYIRQRMGKNFFLIGVGGISSPEDAYAMLCSGANLIQVYTALIYQGPLLPARINRGLLGLMERDGIQHISELRHFWNNANRQLSA
ncbi:MAG: quinone-dependent dihydroorotate dehydrogenase [Candidatus Portnoybacteria bacterium]|nr:quinone-dependent dihydroorotate dehydrogenase [Candidatus Portnoybacteria bacterium]